jgi:orotate phosphoribosyltransferase
MNLFKSGTFTSHSGKVLPYKIDCDALTDDDINTIASIIAARIKFDRVIGIPTGGLRLQYALGRYIGLGQNILIVDDVLTTGSSMEEKRQEIIADHRGFTDEIVGWVIFARTEPPDWINAVFTTVPD